MSQWHGMAWSFLAIVFFLAAMLLGGHIWEALAVLRGKKK